MLRIENVVAAIRATFPPLGVRFLASGAEYGFRKRHRRIGAHCTLRHLDDARRETLLTLLDLAGESSPSACWDDQRAIELLRKEATAQELRDLGADEHLIRFVFPEHDDR